MKLIDRWRHRLTCKLAGIPSTPDEYRKALRDSLVAESQKRGLPITIIGCMNLSIEIGPLNVHVDPESMFPDIFVKTKMVEERIAGLPENIRRVLREGADTKEEIKGPINTDTLSFLIVTNAALWRVVVA